MKIILGDFSAKLERDDIFKPTNKNESLHQDSNDNDFRIVTFSISKNLVVESTMFLHLKIHEYTWISPDGKTHNQIDYIVVHRRCHSNILDIRSCRGADCNTDHYLVIAKVRERLVVSKQISEF
jgi:hypothetical protein